MFEGIPQKWVPHLRRGLIAAKVGFVRGGIPVRRIHLQLSRAVEEPTLATMKLSRRWGTRCLYRNIVLTQHVGKDVWDVIGY